MAEGSICFVLPGTYLGNRNRLGQPQPPFRILHYLPTPTGLMKLIHQVGTVSDHLPPGFKFNCSATCNPGIFGAHLAPIVTGTNVGQAQEFAVGLLIVAVPCSLLEELLGIWVSA